MKKVLFTLLAGFLISAQAMAVSVKDVCGQFDGNLNIGGDLYPDKSVYLLPGVVNGTVTFVLPDFMYGAGKLGNIVLPNIPMDADGRLTLDNSTLWLDSISERAAITVLNGFEDGGVVYNSVVSASEAMILLSITAPSLPEPIFVLFMGKAAEDRNFQMPNGGFEGVWTDGEPAGWHSFNSADGLMVDFIKNDKQFVPSDRVRPGSAGAQSALLSSDLLFGVKANGNCTNGQINAGSMTADDQEANYNFSDPANTGFNTPFHGRPDSIVFWAEYLPADRDAAKAENKARVCAVITTDARYQDPEAEVNYSGVKIGAAVMNYAAAADLGWQRVAVPFAYEQANRNKKPSYILTTFTTNQVPGGGTSYSSGGNLSKVNVLDTVYLDDVEMIYNKRLQSFTRNLETLDFDKSVASVSGEYCDDCAKYAAVGDGVSAQTFIAFDSFHRCIFIYVIADDYAQTGDYTLYRVDFEDSQTDDLDPVDGIMDVLSEQEEGKMLVGGHLYIRRGGVWYNVMGLRIK